MSERSHSKHLVVEVKRDFFFFLLQEMLGELFTPIETPEAQNRGFLKGFFGGNANTFDREELCVFPIPLFHVFY